MTTKHITQQICVAVAVTLHTQHTLQASVLSTAGVTRHFLYLGVMNSYTLYCVCVLLYDCYVMYVE